MTDVGQSLASPKAGVIALILFTVTSNAAAQIMLKLGMTQVGAVSLEQGLVPTVLRIALQPWVVFGLLTFGISMASHLIVLSRVDLSFAYPFLSIAYIIVAAYSFFFLGENITSPRLIGYGLICLGTLFVASS